MKDAYMALDLWESCSQGEVGVVRSETCNAGEEKLLILNMVMLAYLETFLWIVAVPEI